MEKINLAWAIIWGVVRVVRGCNLLEPVAFLHGRNFRRVYVYVSFRLHQGQKEPQIKLRYDGKDK